MKGHVIKDMECIFCKIVAKQLPAFRFWEDHKHVAFLSIFPNTPGATVVITKEHHSSDIFSLPEDVICQLTIAAQKVAHILNAKLPNVGRTALVYEGYGVNHAHAKLFPMHGTKEFTDKNWKPIKSNNNTFFESYPGYISSHDCANSTNEELKEIINLLGDTKNPDS
ncbi:MAG: HIT family protein [Janthinobacterium lividum]